ncbi:hypothetical protein [Streptomyces bluensis]|uniref:hypothetical protein n=1 Tax=Streptomyces bluensis TaxID=33897 RepID=UPI0019996C13|nr:hypothetical protein [Streptomyces bluensis]GGZ80106.1 hypothetical protein GCM10010344_54030 [Streptomyces bluensis]
MPSDQAQHLVRSPYVRCESSARDAATTGQRVLMVADANAARRDQDHNAALHTIYRSFGDNTVLITGTLTIRRSASSPGSGERPGKNAL